LIYLGVAHSLPASQETRLVVDIGGGSTEFIVGAGNQPHRLESLYMGCVSYSLRYFAGGKIGKSDMKHAETAARIELETIKKQFSRKHWQQAVGSSGTARAIADIMETSGWSTSGITRDGMERLRQALMKAGDSARLNLPGLKDDRIAVLPGGFAIMSAIFAELDVEHMALATGAMRQGILWDMIGRAHRRDMRELTVRQFVKRYHVDAGQAHRVERLALKLYEQLADGGKEEHEYPMHMLSWAARLQEIGLTVAHSGYHKHSSYIVAHASFPCWCLRIAVRSASCVGSSGRTTIGRCWSHCGWRRCCTAAGPRSGCRRSALPGKNPRSPSSWMRSGWPRIRLPRPSCAMRSRTGRDWVSS